MGLPGRSVYLLILTYVFVSCATLGEVSIIVSDSQAYRTNAYPSVGLLDDGRLLCVYSVRGTGTSNKMCVAGSYSSDHGRTWSKPMILIDTPDYHDYDPGLVVIGPRVMVTSTATPVKTSSQITTSRTVAVVSPDSGGSWSEPHDIPMGRRYTSGKVNNGLVLRDGSAIFGYTWEDNLEKHAALPSEGDMEEVSAVMISFDDGRTWTSGEGVGLEKRKLAGRPHAINGLCEPALAECSDGSLYMLCRTGLDRLYELRSHDGGRTWSDPIPSPLIGHNAPAALCAVDTDKGDGFMVVWNRSPENRWPLCVSLSFDDGRTWSAPVTFADKPGLQSSYPGCIQAADGWLVVVYQQQLADGGRDILAVRLHPATLLAAED